MTGLIVAGAVDNSGPRPTRGGKKARRPAMLSQGLHVEHWLRWYTVVSCL
jgi:hypothetical protein